MQSRAQWWLQAVNERRSFQIRMFFLPWLPLAIEPNCWWPRGILGGVLVLVLVLVQEHVKHVNENISFGSIFFRWRSTPGDHQDFTVPEYHINCLSRYQILRFGKVLQREEELTVHGQMRKLHTMQCTWVYDMSIQGRSKRLSFLSHACPDWPWDFCRCTRAKTNKHPKSGGEEAYRVRFARCVSPGDHFSQGEGKSCSPSDPAAHPHRPLAVIHR